MNKNGGMTTITFDTHKIIQTLKASGIEERQAEAITNAVRDAQASADIATKGDIELFRKDLEMTRRDIDSRDETPEMDDRDNHGSLHCHSRPPLPALADR